MRIVSEQEFLPFWLMKKTGFAMMWVTPVSTVRVHSVSLLDHKADPKSANKLGIALVQTVDALQAGYEHLFEQLESRLGRPDCERAWWRTDLMDAERYEYEYACADWRLDNCMLTLLLNHEGDGHIGEMGTVDVRIRPRGTRPGRQRKGHDVLSWPVEY